MQLDSYKPVVLVLVPLSLGLTQPIQVGCKSNGHHIYALASSSGCNCAIYSILLMSTWFFCSSINFSNLMLSYGAEGSLFDADQTGQTHDVMDHL